MSFVSGLRRRMSRTVKTLAATVTAAGMMLTGVSVAHADQGVLREGCEWDAAGYYVQRCKVWSSAMNVDIHVQIKPAAQGGNAGLYMLDGLRATDEGNGWVLYGGAPATFENDNITLVMPVGGQSSFYADWQGLAKLNPNEPINYQWETFLTQELPGYLEQQFGVARNNNSITGLSMGGTAAMNLAAKHPDQFRQVLSYSGYLTMTAPGSYLALTAVLLDGGGYNVLNLYGNIINPKRFENDPFLNMGGLRNSDVYVSAATGMLAPWEVLGINPADYATGYGLEVVSRATTMAWAAKAKLSGISVGEDYPILGTHNWNNWNDQLVKTHQRVLDVML